MDGKGEGKEKGMGKGRGWGRVSTRLVKGGRAASSVKPDRDIGNNFSTHTH